MKTIGLVLIVAALGSLFPAVNPGFAQNRTLTSAPNAGWTSIASSSDGARLVAVAEGNPVTGSPKEQTIQILAADGRDEPFNKWM